MNFFPIWALPNQNFWLRQWSWVNDLMVFKKGGLGLEKIGGLDKSCYITALCIFWQK